MGLVCDFPYPKLYNIEIDPSGLKIVKLTGFAWALTISCFRKYKNSDLDFFRKYIIDTLKNADIICGKIADDRISDIIDDFIEDSVSLECMLAAMSRMNIGIQYALKTYKACNQIDKIMEIGLKSLKGVRNQAIQNRIDGSEIYFNVRKEFLGKGIYFSQIIEKLKKEPEFFDGYNPKTHMQESGPTF